MNQNPIKDVQIYQPFHEHLAVVVLWVGDIDLIQYTRVIFNDIINNPNEVFQQVADFLDYSVDPEAMVIDWSLNLKYN